MMGRMTEFGMGGIGDAEGVAVSMNCGVVDVKGVFVDCDDVESVGPEDCGRAVERICCEGNGSALTVGPDAEPSAS
jgi:hypothetical protein